MVIADSYFSGPETAGLFAIGMFAGAYVYWMILDSTNSRMRADRRRETDKMRRKTMGMDDIEGDERKPTGRILEAWAETDDPGLGAGRGIRGPMDRNVPLDEGAPGTFDHPSLHAPATEGPIIRPAAKKIGTVRVTWKDADGHAQSIVMGQGPAEAILPALVRDLLADPPQVTDIRIRKAS